MNQMAADWSAELAEDRPLLDRASTAERVAEVLRTRIVEGLLPPGTQLSEETIGTALRVSRNTLREAFRLLCNERLAVHELNRGVFVRVLSEEDVIDLYRLRRLIECGAIREARHPSAEALAAVRAAVDDGQQAAQRGDGRGIGTADLRFHQALAGLVSSRRVNDVMRGLLAELRLVFHVMVSPQDFHEHYLARNQQICQLLEQGDSDAAERVLAGYLDEAEAELLAAYRAGNQPQPTAPASKGRPAR